MHDNVQNIHCNYIVYYDGIRCDFKSQRKGLSSHVFKLDQALLMSQQTILVQLITSLTNAEGDDRNLETKLEYLRKEKR